MVYETTNDDEIKHCWFDRVGYRSKGKEKCKFLHNEEICECYLQNGYYDKVRCIERHPRKCYYDWTSYCWVDGWSSQFHGQRRARLSRGAHLLGSWRMYHLEGCC